MEVATAKRIGPRFPLVLDLSVFSPAQTGPAQCAPPNPTGLVVHTSFA
jgi:hypothetical protein